MAGCGVVGFTTPASRGRSTDTHESAHYNLSKSFSGESVCKCCCLHGNIRRHTHSNLERSDTVHLPDLSNARNRTILIGEATVRLSDPFPNRSRVGKCYTLTDGVVSFLTSFNLIASRESAAAAKPQAEYNLYALSRRKAVPNSTQNPESNSCEHVDRSVPVRGFDGGARSRKRGRCASVGSVTFL
jgi:hypothetical protein